jgi:hypothetical protein
MGLIERTLDSGLIVSEYGDDHASIERELKRRDPDLTLQGWPSQTHGCILWKVVRHAGSDRPPDTVCVWQSERGEPYPLSSGILEMVDRLDRNTRSVVVNADDLNAAVDRERAERVNRENQAIREDHEFPHGHPVTPRGQWLRMSRDKQRAKGKKV